MPSNEISEWELLVLSLFAINGWIPRDQLLDFCNYLKEVLEKCTTAKVYFNGFKMDEILFLEDQFYCTKREGDKEFITLTPRFLEEEEGETLKILCIGFNDVLKKSIIDIDLRSVYKGYQLITTS